MALSTREIILAIRAREDASRALRGLSREMRGLDAQARASQARAAAAALRTQAEQVRMTGMATRNQLDQLRRATVAQLAYARANEHTRDQINALRQRIAAYSNQMNASSRADQMRIRQLQDMARRYDEQARSVGEATRRHQAYANMLHNTSEGLIAVGFALTAMGVGALVASKHFIDVAMEYQRQVSHTRTQVDKLAIAHKTLADIGIRTVNDIAVKFEQIQPALFDIFSSMEVGARDAEILLRAFSKGAVAGQTEIQAVSRATIGLMNAFRRPVSDVNKLLDLQFELVQEGVGTYEEWAQRIGLVTPSAVRAGQSVETMVAALATATRMGISAARAGTSVARAFDAMSHPKTVKNLKQMGVNALDAKGKFRPLVDVLGEFREKLMKLPPAKRLAAMLDVFKGAGGTIEARRFLQNVLLGAGGLELFKTILDETTKSSGNMERAYGEMAGTAAAKSELLRNKWMILKEALGAALLPAFTDLVEGLSKVVDWFNKLPESQKQMISQMLIWTGVIGTALGIVLLLVGGLAGLVAVIGLAGPLFLAVTGFVLGFVGGLIALGAAFYTAWQNSEEFKRILGEVWENVQTLWGIISAFAISVWTAFQTYVLPPLRDLWRIIETEVLPRVRGFISFVANEFLPRFQEAARIVRDFVNKELRNLGESITTNLIPAIWDLIHMWDENKAHIMPFVVILAQVAKAMLIVVGVIFGSMIGALAFLLGMFRLSVTAVRTVIAILHWLGDALRTAGRWVNDLKGKILEWIHRLRSGAGETRTAMTNIKNAVINALRDAGNWLVNAGRNVIQGLVNGIRSKIDDVKNAAAAAATAARNAVTGLLGIRSPSTVFRSIGVNTVQGMVNGLKASKRDLQRTALDVFGMRDLAQMGSFGPLNPQGRVAGLNRQEGTLMPLSKQVSQTFYITTQEIDPRKHAAQLGWELEGRGA